MSQVNQYRAIDDRETLRAVLQGGRGRQCWTTAPPSTLMLWPVIQLPWSLQR